MTSCGRHAWLCAKRAVLAFADEGAREVVLLLHVVARAWTRLFLQFLRVGLPELLRTVLMPPDLIAAPVLARLLLHLHESLVRDHLRLEFLISFDSLVFHAFELLRDAGRVQRGEESHLLLHVLPVAGIAGRVMLRVHVDRGMVRCVVCRY